MANGRVEIERGEQFGERAGADAMSGARSGSPGPARSRSRDAPADLAIESGEALAEVDQAKRRGDRQAAEEEGARQSSRRQAPAEHEEQRREVGLTIVNPLDAEALAGPSA